MTPISELRARVAKTLADQEGRPIGAVLDVIARLHFFMLLEIIARLDEIRSRQRGRE